MNIKHDNKSIQVNAFELKPVELEYLTIVELRVPMAERTDVSAWSGLHGASKRTTVSLIEESIANARPFGVFAAD